MKNKIIVLAIAALLAAAAGASDVAVKRPWAAREDVAAGVVSAGADQAGLAEAIQDIYVDGSDVWVATINGLGRTNDYGMTWRNYFRGEMTTPTDDVVAAAARDGDIWASCIEIVTESFETHFYGRGLAHYDSSAGRWFVYGKAPDKGGLPVDGEYELAWDVIIDDEGVVWVALWNGGIGKSEDNGRTWEVIKPVAGPGEESTHIYSLAKRGDLIWAAAELDSSTGANILTGAFKSEDNGETWSYYGLQHGVNGLCAVVDIQPAPGRDIVWVGTAPADASGPGHGVFKSEDGGATWVNYDAGSGLAQPTVYAFDSAGTWAWAGTYDGVDRTGDYGDSWNNAGTGDGLPWYQINVLTAASEAEVWAGTDLGVGYSSDGGVTWREIELTPAAGRIDLRPAFAFPSPFAQERDGRVTFRYGLATGGNVTLDVYDFAGRRVKRVVDNEYRGPGDRIDEYWNGLRDDGIDAANGVYFFIIQVDGNVAADGKFVVLN